MQPLHTLCRRIGNFVLLFGAMPDLHYINGPDTLPPPLTPQQEQQALCGLAAGEGAARDALITHNLRLVVYIAKKFESSTAGVEGLSFDSFVRQFVYALGLAAAFPCRAFATTTPMITQDRIGA